MGQEDAQRELKSRLNQFDGLYHMPTGVYDAQMHKVDQADIDV